MPETPSPASDDAGRAGGSGSPLGRRRASLLKSLGYFVPSYALAIVGYLLLNAVAAQILGVAGFGYYAIIVTVTTLVGQLALVGVHRSGLREATQAETEEELARLRRGAEAVLLVPLLLGSLLTGAVIWLVSGAGSADVATGLWCAVITYGSGFQVLSGNFLRGLGYVRAASLLSGRSGGTLVALTQAAAVVVVAWLMPDPGLTAVLGGTAAGFVPVLLWAGWLLHRSLPRDSRSHPLLHDLRLVVRRDWRFALSQSGAFLNASVDIWVAGAVLPAVATSQFAAAQRLGRLLLVPVTALQTVFSPAIARFAGSGDLRGLERLVRTAASVATAGVGLLWLPMVLAPALLLSTLFGEEFGAASAVLVLIATQYLFNAVSGMTGTTLSMARHEAVVARLTWLVVVLRVGFGALAASLWGATGLAASALSVATFYYLLTWLAARRRLGIATHATLRPRLGLLRRTPG